MYGCCAERGVGVTSAAAVAVCRAWLLVGVVFCVICCSGPRYAFSAAQLLMDSMPYGEPPCPAAVVLQLYLQHTAAAASRCTAPLRTCLASQHA
jgi:hypothetical protein